MEEKWCKQIDVIDLCRAIDARDARAWQNGFLAHSVSTARIRKIKQIDDDQRNASNPFQHSTLCTSMAVCWGFAKRDACKCILVSTITKRTSSVFGLFKLFSMCDEQRTQLGSFQFCSQFVLVCWRSNVFRLRQLTVQR